ncbi:Pre-mRNA-splicing factor SPP2 [Paramyrothecium foliicola]|nr:Pre-mRNA-splicing factor SPP2 [Paramyrothecium foliicola]
MSDPNKGRIAIKLGAGGPSSKSARPKPPSALGKRQRSGAWGDGSDSGSDDESRGGRHETITGFGAEGAETKSKFSDRTKAPKEYVIPRQANRDWKDEARAQRRQKNPLPGEARAQKDGYTVETEPADHEKGIKWGLTVKEKERVDGAEEDSEDTTARNRDHEPNNNNQASPPPKRTVDDEAMDVLLGKAPEKDLAVIHPTEEDAFLRDVRNSGEASTLADYEAMPVEEFGAALLRGMGWNGEARGPKPKEVKRRPNRLGLGAKELKEAEDLGGWNQNGKKRSRPRLDEYRREESRKKESRRNDDSYKRERERERERERDRDGDRDRNRDRPRDRDRDYDRHRDRHRDYDRDRRR